MIPDPIFHRLPGLLVAALILGGALYLWLAR